MSSKDPRGGGYLGTKEFLESRGRCQAVHGANGTPTASGPLDHGNRHAKVILGSAASVPLWTPRPYPCFTHITFVYPNQTTLDFCPISD